MTFASFTDSSAAEVLAKLNTSNAGLSAREAAARLAKGRNELPHATLRWGKILLRQFSSPFLYLLAFAAGISWFLGEYVDAGMIAGFVLINASLGFAQEYHSERAVALLSTFVRSQSRVRRAGTEQSVESTELVPGDLLIVETGDIIHADIRFTDVDGLCVDESVLTGESAQVEKRAAALARPTDEPYKALNIGFAGTTVVSGRGTGVVIGTGTNTQIGSVTTLTAQTNGESAFEKNLGRFSTFILKTIVVTLVVVFVANVAIKGGNVNLPELLIFAIALAVSVIPEALPVVTTMTLSRGALVLARKKVVVKRLSAVEDLGSIEVLCSDKTGTLTENALTVTDVFGEDHERILLLACAASSFLGEKRPTPNNAFDIAVWNRLSESDHAKLVAAARSNEVPFDPVRRWNSVVVNGEKIVRGAPEEVVKLCTHSYTKALVWAAEQGRKGRRTIAIAAGRPAARAFELVGLIAFEDPIKSTAPHAIALAKKLGVQVKILTGDSAEVATAVGREVGLLSEMQEALTGEAWEALPKARQCAVAQQTSVFARVSPQQKFAVIECLRGTFEVGFLGEGINDAPALKIASVGIVVDTASDIAREAADIVLLQHSLDVIVRGIREGRAVFANTVKYIKATLASNFGNFLAIAAATLLIDYLPMLSVQILLLNLLSDFPMIAIALDTVDASELRRPRAYDLRDIVYSATVLGVVSTIFDFIFFAVFKRYSPEVLHTNWFIGSVLTELVLVFSIRTRRPFWKAAPPSFVLVALSGLAAIAAVVLPYVPESQRVFQFVTPPEGTLALVLVIVVVYFAVTETVKLAYERFRR